MESLSISVVMSVFNGQAFLSEAIESILGQTFRAFEFVVIDDGSTDKTREIISAYASRDARMRVFCHKNKGRAESLNIGISLAKGNYIARMDADDVAPPHRLQDQDDFMQHHPEVGLLGGAVELINTQGHVFKTVRPPLQDSEIRSAMLHYNPIFHSSVIMRKEVVLAVGGYRKALFDADDYDLFLRIGEQSRFANLGEPVLQYRIHANQVSVQNMRRQVLCLLAASAAASLRKLGSPDPLSHVEEVTPQLLDTLGVNTARIQQGLLDAYSYWINVLKQSEPEAALRVIDELWQLSRSVSVDRSVLANTWLIAAGIHYSQERLAKALVSAAHAVLVRPIIAARPVKRVFTRVATALKSGRRS
jgi:hypothetical protein